MGKDDEVLVLIDDDCEEQDDGHEAEDLSDHIDEIDSDDEPSLAKGEQAEQDAVKDTASTCSVKSASTNPIDKKKVRKIAKLIKKGGSPKAEGLVDTIVQPAVVRLAKKTRLQFYILIALSVAVPVMAALVGRSFLHVEAQGIPKVEFLDEAEAASISPHRVQAFTWEVAIRMNTWNWWDWQTTRDEMRNLFAPAMQGQFDEWFVTKTKTAKQDKKRQIAFRIGTVYRGVKQQTVHNSFCCYELWEGLGTTPANFEVHRMSERIVILESIEGEPTDSNPEGLYVIKITDTDRETFIDFYGYDPWDELYTERNPEKRAKAAARKK